MAILGTFVFGDTDKSVEWTLRNRTTGALIDLTSATNAKVYARRVGSRVIVMDGVAATTGGAAGTFSFVPGAQSTLAPGDKGKRAQFEVWGEYDLGGTHRTVPDDGPDTIVVVDLR